MTDKKHLLKTSYAVVLLIILSIFTLLKDKAFSVTLSAIVKEEHLIKESGIIIDNKTGKSIAGALISIPSKRINTVSDKFGMFQLDVPGKSPLILSVKANGYKPFSLIIDKQKLQNSLKIAIVEETKNEIIIDTELRHLGDNKFSASSANSGDFSISASGHYFFQEFYINNINFENNILLKIGSIIGIDTKTAQSLGQSDVMTSSSSPVKVFFNSQKIGEISFNGNNHIFRIPFELLRLNSYNHVKIETGINLASDTDYDDIEFMNLFLEFK